MDAINSTESKKLVSKFQKFLDEYWKNLKLKESEIKIDSSVKISPSLVNEYGQLSLKTNLPIFHE